MSSSRNDAQAQKGTMLESCLYDVVLSDVAYTQVSHLERFLQQMGPQIYSHRAHNQNNTGSWASSLCLASPLTRTESFQTTEDVPVKITKTLEHALKELLTSERTYVKRIEALLHRYAIPLRQLAQDQDTQIIPAHEAERMFGNLGEIVAANKMLLCELEILFEQGYSTMAASIGDTMEQNMHRFACYDEYMGDFEQAKTIYTQMLKNKAFRGFIERTQHNANDLGNAGLRELMIEPLQRIPRYRLLLNNIMKELSPSSEQYHRLHEANSLAGRIASRDSNDATRRSAILWSCSQQIDKFPFDLATSRRELLGCIDVEERTPETQTGVLNVFGSVLGRKRSSNYALLIFDDILLLSQKHSNTPTHQILQVQNPEKLIDSMQNRQAQSSSAPKKYELTYEGQIDLSQLLATGLDGSQARLAFFSQLRGSHNKSMTRIFSDADPSQNLPRMSLFLDCLWKAQAVNRARSRAMQVRATTISAKGERPAHVMLWTILSPSQYKRFSQKRTPLFQIGSPSSAKQLQAAHEIDLCVNIELHPVEDKGTVTIFGAGDAQHEQTLSLSEIPRLCADVCYNTVSLSDMLKISEPTSVEIPVRRAKSQRLPSRKGPAASRSRSLMSEKVRVSIQSSLEAVMESQESEVPPPLPTAQPSHKRSIPLSEISNTMAKRRALSLKSSKEESAMSEDQLISEYQGMNTNAITDLPTRQMPQQANALTMPAEISKELPNPFEHEEQGANKAEQSDAEKEEESEVEAQLKECQPEPVKTDVSPADSNEFATMQVTPVKVTPVLSQQSDRPPTITESAADFDGIADGDMQEVAALIESYEAGKNDKNNDDKPPMLDFSFSSTIGEVRLDESIFRETDNRVIPGRENIRAQLSNQGKDYSADRDVDNVLQAAAEQPKLLDDLPKQESLLEWNLLDTPQLADLTTQSILSADPGLAKQLSHEDKPSSSAVPSTSSSHDADKPLPAKPGPLTDNAPGAGKHLRQPSNSLQHQVTEEEMQQMLRPLLGQLHDAPTVQHVVREEIKEVPAPQVAEIEEEAPEMDLTILRLLHEEQDRETDTPLLSQIPDLRVAEPDTPLLPSVRAESPVREPGLAMKQAMRGMNEAIARLREHRDASKAASWSSDWTAFKNAVTIMNSCWADMDRAYEDKQMQLAALQLSEPKSPQLQSTAGELQSLQDEANMILPLRIQIEQLNKKVASLTALEEDTRMENAELYNVFNEELQNLYKHTFRPADEEVSALRQALMEAKAELHEAILIGERASLIEFPSLLLPQGISVGSVVNILVTRNEEEEQKKKEDFVSLQDDILQMYGINSPSPPTLRLRNITQTTVTLEWDPLQLANADLHSLDIVRNGQRIAKVPRPLSTTSTKLSGLSMDAEYTIQLVLYTSAGTFASDEISTRTHSIQNTSGIHACLGYIDDPILLEATKDIIKSLGAHWTDNIQIDTTHLITTHAPSSDTSITEEAKVYDKAQQLSIPIVQPYWLFACESEKRMVNISGYYVDTLAPNAMQVKESLAKKNGKNQTAAPVPSNDTLGTENKAVEVSGNTSHLVSEEEANDNKKSLDETQRSISKDARDSKVESASPNLEDATDTNEDTAGQSNRADETLESEMENIAL
ncbi:hypothetical protein MPSI1_000021 [Malassezia psittaci]|uniref:DH domain-containing protein n=1 Tax=Malassezia psittaci TaxID=1821823 RepID=A0AAF0F688_9BASI|nr:hypothetical protein MPSI1_000021 [Malassezia psittaci]